MKKESVDFYYENYKKYENKEISHKEWNEICLRLLGEIMEEHKDVFFRLKKRV